MSATTGSGTLISGIWLSDGRAGYIALNPWRSDIGGDSGRSLWGSGEELWVDSSDICSLCSRIQFVVASVLFVGAGFVVGESSSSIFLC